MLMTEAAPYELGPTFQFELEELHHLVWANSVDARISDRPVWIGLDRAVAAGARAVEPGGVGDVVLADGTVAWLDGGPVRHVDPIDGVPVVSAVAVEHGSMATPGPNVSTADLAPDQLAAVTHAGGGARIIAPAGSGKTRVLTERARHLLTALEPSPERGQSRGVQQAGTGGDASNAHRPAGPPGAHPQRDRAGDRQRHAAVRAAAAAVAHHRRARRATHHRRSRRRSRGVATATRSVRGSKRSP